MDFLENVGPEWLEAQYLRWKQDPEQLSSDWQAFFAGYELASSTPPEFLKSKPDDLIPLLKQSGVQSLIYRFRDIGHLLACTDPLSPCPVSHPLLDLSAFGLDEGDLDTVFHTRRFLKPSATLREILETMKETYCHSIGVEFMHITEPAERQWLIERMEPSRNKTVYSPEEQLEILRKTTEAALFEAFLHRRFPGQKRFSLEGGESFIPLLNEVANKAAQSGMSELVLGMAHRGRLNVLAGIMGKPLANIFAEFADNLEFGFVGEGDVKYHKGFSADREFGGRLLHLTLAFNPSHLEAIDPVVEGKCRAIQDRMGEEGRKRIMPVLVHGDAAFAGQGVVAETLNLSNLEGYGCGGTLHIIINNQIGFTTLPADARSTRYATDPAKMLQVPIFHVHGESPEAVATVARLAFDYRQTFGRDVLIEIICYRRYGHNEGDEPYFTQPLMYERIKDRPPVHKIYADQLISEGVDPLSVQELEEELTNTLERALSESPDPTADIGFTGDWQRFSRGYETEELNTALPRESLLELAERLAQLPSGFKPHPKVSALLQKRVESVRNGGDIDWGNAEALSFGSLLSEGVTIRLSGQDSRRGTFNHRHAVLHNIENDAVYTPLSALTSEGASLYIYDSMLSEYAVLGFEYGYAVASPESLVIWEAQFGDFANGGQVLIDQFISSGESKWDRSCGLVMLLPHGYEGNGAEHSSARIERYLQLCAENNMQVVYPSVPAQFFHLLRRQVKQRFRKPLIVFTPKGLLRHPDCVSGFNELTGGGFMEIIPDNLPPDKVLKVLLCSGKLYFELDKHRKDIEDHTTAIIRIEQLYPLRCDLLRDIGALYGSNVQFIWVQEEPKNMGMWSYIRPCILELTGREPLYVGRPASAAPATGSHRMHKVEQDRIIRQAFGEDIKE